MENKSKGPKPGFLKPDDARLVSFSTSPAGCDGWIHVKNKTAVLAVSLMMSYYKIRTIEVTKIKIGHYKHNMNVFGPSEKSIRVALRHAKGYFPEPEDIAVLGEVPTVTPEDLKQSKETDDEVTEVSEDAIEIVGATEVEEIEEVEEVEEAESDKVDSSQLSLKEAALNIFEAYPGLLVFFETTKLGRLSSLYDQLLLDGAKIAKAFRS